MRLLVLSAALLAAPGCAPSAFQRAAGADTADAYRAFLRQHPEDRDVPAARERLSQLELDAARATHTVVAYKRFLDEFPDSGGASAARALLEALRFNAAQDLGTAQALRQFLVDHSDGAHAAQARQRLAELDLRAAATLDDPERISTALAAHPDDPGRGAAEARLDDVSFSRALGAGTLALLRYLREFPAGAHRDEARLELLSRQLDGLLFSGEVEAAVAAASQSPLSSKLPDLAARLERAQRERSMVRDPDPLAGALWPAHSLRDLDDVARALRAPDPLDRWQAAEELGQHVHVRAIDPLLDAVRGTRHPLLRQRAFDALGSVLRSLPPRIADHQVGIRVAALREQADAPDVHLSLAVLLDLSGRLADAAPEYQKAFDPAAPDPIILRRWATVRRDRGQHHAAAVAARQLAVWAEGVARERGTGAGGGAAGEAPLSASRQLCAAVEVARFAESTVAAAAAAGTEFPEDVADFRRQAEGARKLAEARLRDVELQLKAADRGALTCDDARVAERIAAGVKERERLLRAVRRDRPRLAAELLRLAAERDPSEAIRRIAAAELFSLERK